MSNEHAVMRSRGRRWRNYCESCDLQRLHRAGGVPALDQKNWLEAKVLAGVNFVPAPMKSFLGPLLRSGSIPFALTNTRNNRIVARMLLTAFDSASRRKGLLDHESLAEGSALIIAPSSAIHTFAMRFAIDVMFVSKDGRVLKVRRDVRPRRVAAAWRAFAVVELPVGAIDRSETRPGDQLQVGAL